MAETKTTIDRDVIKEWVERRGGKPKAIIEEGNLIGNLMIDLPAEQRGDELAERINWDEWFEKFDKEKLAFLFMDESFSGEESNYHQFVKRVEGNLNELSKAKTTFDHGEIMAWAKRRGAVPSSIKGTEDRGEVAGILKFDFSGDPELEVLSWDEFFRKFEKEKLAFAYKDMEPDGQYSHWYEFENRN